LQLIKSLFCWHGFDNRQRFIFISLTCFLAFIILNESLSDYKLSAIVMLVLCSSTYLAATRRRLNDAHLHNSWILAPAGSFLVTGFFIVFTGYNSSYWLLLIPLLMMVVLLTYPTKSQRRYILGYHGPVNLSDFQQLKKTNSRNNQRIEPTMNSVNINQSSNKKNDYSPLADNSPNTPSTTHANHFSDSSQDKVELAESIRLALFSKKNSQLTIALISFLLVLAFIISMLFAKPTPAENPVGHTSEIQKIVKEFQHQITLPDNFSIMIAADNAIVIQWQASVEDNLNVWALGTAQGDKSCKSIEFTKEEMIRTYSVSTLDNKYYAYFSPLDTKALIKNIAFKNKFSLCGYNFSLKGSQARLGKSPFYANSIEY
jgi:uncharacterized membrane protein YhaH (DUF805 family)